MNAPMDLAAVKGRQQLAWASGDYAVVGTTLQIVGESLAGFGPYRPAPHFQQSSKVAGFSSPQARQNRTPTRLHAVS